MVREFEASLGDIMGIRLALQLVGSCLNKEIKEILKQIIIAFCKKTEKMKNACDS